MKSGNIFWGILFIILGLLYLLVNVFNVQIELSTLYNYWPIILILFGLSFLTANKIAKTVSVAGASVFLSLVIFSFFSGNNFHCNSDDDDWIEDKNLIETVTRDYEDRFKNMDVHIYGGAGTFSIGSSDEYLYDINSKAASTFFSIDTMSADDFYKLEIKMDDNVINLDDGKPGNRKLALALNKNPAYNIECKLGAAAADLDLRKLKVGKVNIEMGAASLNLELSEPPQDSSYVDIEAGASSIEISVPKDLAVEVTNEMKISKNSFPGFTEVNESTFRSENFSSSIKKIFIKLNGAVSKVKIRRD
jgi:uncharacterized integral membrane protein